MDPGPETIEADAEALFRAADVDSAMPWPPRSLLVALAERRIDRLHAVRWVEPANDAPSRLCEEREGWAIEMSVALRGKHHSAQAAWLFAHEAGEWRARVHGVPANDVRLEQYANNWGAAILVPRRALAVAVDCWGAKLGPLAASLRVSRRIVLQRLGEALGYAVAFIDARAAPLFGRPLVIRRGPLERGILSDARLVELAYRPERALAEGWSVERLGDGVRAVFRGPEDES